MSSQQLPEDLIFSILTHVPTRSLMRLVLVCQSWGKWIFDTYSARIHHRAPISGFFSVRDDPYGGQDQDFVDEEQTPSYTAFTGDNGGGGIPRMARDLLSEGFVAVASCNGLICFRKGTQLRICNPITQTSATITDSTLLLPLLIPAEHSLIDVQLIYDLKVSTDFKIVKIWSDSHNKPAFFHVFISRDGCWRQLSKTAPRKPRGYYIASSDFGEEGGVCWLEEHSDGCIARVYDLGTNSLWSLPLPQLDEGKKKHRSKTRFMGNLVKSVSGGKVYLMRELNKNMVLWRLEGRERRWRMEFEGNKKALKWISQGKLIEPLAYDAEERKLIVAEGYTVKSYDLVNKRMELIARDVNWFYHQQVVFHWNKAAPFTVCKAALVD